MKTILEPRASAILYTLLKSIPNGFPFLIPANICQVVPMTFMKARRPFRFVDISASSLHMDTDQVLRTLMDQEDKIGGILYAHTYGDPWTPDQFFREVKARWPMVLVIDDRCLCVPDLHHRNDSAADVTLYSTGYAKIVDLGIGGYAFIHNLVPYDHSVLHYEEQDLTDMDQKFKVCVAEGRHFEYKDSAWLQTEADLPSWSKYAEMVEIELQQSLVRREEINKIYNSLIPVEVVLPHAFQLWRYNLRLSDRDRVLRQIFDAGLFASSHYRSLVGIMGDGTGENAAALSAQVLNLFNDHHYTTDMAERTARIVVRNLKTDVR